MVGSSALGGDLRRFRLLAELTAGVTFLLIVAGGIVRVSDSGLGCGAAGSGTEGWPLCGGQVIPLIGGVNRLVEFTHRSLASIVVVLIAILVYLAYRGLRGLRWPLRGSLVAGLLVLAQAGLGGLTVENNLQEELVAAHLCMAMLLLALLLWLVVKARAEAGRQPGEPDGGARPAPSSAVRGLKPFAGAAAVLLLSAIVAGGYMAGTEEQGAEHAAASGAHLACGEEFPGCLGRGPFPFGVSRLTDIHLTHRVLVYAATIAILLLIGTALRRGSRSRLLAVAGGLLLCQLLLGALNVWLGEHPTLVVAHLTVATLLWSSVVLIAYTLAFVPEGATDSRRPPRAQASTAAA
jgi:heme A synthase